MIEVGKTYRLVLKVEKYLYFTGEITEIEKPFFTFIDKFGDTKTYNLSTIQSAEVVHE